MTKTIVQQIVLMVGIPGSGKSFTTDYSLAEADRLGLRAGVVSADHFFYLSNGEYAFNLDMLGLAHMTAQARAKMMLRAGYDIVYVDNTNLSHTK